MELDIEIINYIDIKDLSFLDSTNAPGNGTKDENQKKAEEENTNIAKKILLKQLQEKENCIFLTGAGTSIESGGPTMVMLWSALTGFKGTKLEFENVKDKTLKYAGNDVEEFLSNYDTFISNQKNLGVPVTDDEEFKQELITKIKDECKKAKYTYGKSEHLDFLESIINIRKIDKPRLKVFTLNYDTVFEQAANYRGYIIIDGFSFNIPREFNGNNFDVDIIERKLNRLEEKGFFKKVFHLYKLHGSLDWEKTSIGHIKCDIFSPNAGVIIYPGSSKYEQSYVLPYFEMLTRFQAELRKESVTLNIVGYGFGDKHINSMILEALKNNTSLTINIFGKSSKNLLWVIKGGKLELVHDNLKEFFPYIEKKRVNIFNMYFWGLIGLLKFDNLIKTDSEELADAIDKFSKKKLGT